MLCAMTDQNDQPPGADELYIVAANARSLAVIEHRSGAVDVLAAAAWSPQRIGSVLLRLHSEYDSGQRQRPGDGRTDAQLLAIRLRSMPRAREQLCMQAEKWLMPDANAKARAVLHWWIDKTCPVCHGRRWLAIPGTPSLSGERCPHPLSGGCGGSGELALPHGEDGRRLASFLDDCIARARQSIRDRLHATKK